MSFGRGSRTSAVDFLKINGLWLFLLGSAALLIYRRVHRTSRLTLALIGGGALVLALAAVLLKTIALVLLVPLAGAAIGLLVDLLFGDRRSATRRMIGRARFTTRARIKRSATTAWIADPVR